MSALYEIANSYAKLTDSGLEPEFIADTLDGIEGELEDKASNVMALIKNEQAYSAALKQEAANLTERARVCDNRVANLKDYLARSLSTTGLKSLRAGIHQLSTRAGSKSVVITDLDSIPADYVEYETSIKPDKARIKLHIEAGNEVPGATVKAGKPTLIIK